MLVVDLGIEMVIFTIIVKYMFCFGRDIDEFILLWELGTWDWGTTSLDFSESFPPHWMQHSGADV